MIDYVEGVEDYKAVEWREGGLPFQIIPKNSNEIKTVSWVKGGSEVDLINDPIGVWFEKQVVWESF